MVYESSILSTSHTVRLSDLKSRSVYRFKITAKDAANNETFLEDSFTTSKRWNVR